MNSENLQHIYDVFTALLRLSEAQDEKLTGMGKGFNTSERNGACIHAQARGWLRVIERAKQDACLNELTRMAQEDGLYAGDQGT